MLAHRLSRQYPKHRTIAAFVWNGLLWAQPPPVLQKRSHEVGPPARCNPFPCDAGRDRLSVDQIGGITDATARFHRWDWRRGGVAARGAGAAGGQAASDWLPQPWLPGVGCKDGR